MSWQAILRQNVTCFKKLSSLVELKLPTFPPSFSLNIPVRLVNKIEKGNSFDPILKQFVPLEFENQTNSAFTSDPVGDQIARCSPKGIKKYSTRFLIVTTQACAMHCRYCFRQNFSYTTQKGFSQEIAKIREDTSIREVILSGGDPLSLSDRTLKKLINDLKAPHIKRLRFHTRFPIGIPERITNSFLDILSTTPFQIWFVIHCNHPQELDEEVLFSLQKIQKLGIPVLNQTVLLKGINDSFETLKTLCECLVDHGIQPYYLHQLDRVQGTAHFEVSPEKGRHLIQNLKDTLSGYAVPQYVQEIPGEKSKSVLI